jgi:hypothetical protein
MMRMTFLSSYLVFLFYILPTPAVIIEVGNLELFKKEIETLDSQSLVVFDVDETLITPKDPFLRYLRAPPYNCQIIHQGFGILDCLLEDDVLKGWKEIWFSRILNTMQYQLVDSEFPLLIHQLQKRGIKTIALTAIKSRSFGVIPSMEDWRIKQLQQFDISFSHSFPNHSFLSFTLQSGNPSFKQGVLCADETPKGEALLALLQAIEWIPSKIVFIDDLFEYQQSMESMARKLGILFSGFHYKASELISCDFNKEITAFRFRYLAENGEWLTEEEALISLNQK